MSQTLLRRAPPRATFRVPDREWHFTHRAGERAGGFGEKDGAERPFRPPFLYNQNITVRVEAMSLGGDNPEEVMRQSMVVPDSVTVRSAHKFVDSLLKQLKTAHDLDLDVSAVVEADLAFVEILYSARAQWAAVGHELRLAHPAEGAVVALLERAGFLTDLTPQDLDFWFHGALPQ